jgi:hypothetical protein
MFEFHKHFGENPEKLNILDVGGGLGPLDLYFTNFGFVTNLDLNHDKTWFPTDSQGLLINAKGLKHDKSRLTRVSGDFFESMNYLSDRFDFVYDSCSIIHFQRSIIGKKTNANYQYCDRSILNVAKALSSVTDSTSLIVMATDMAHPKSIAFKEIVYQDRIINSFKLAGFQTQILFGERDYSKYLRPIDRGEKTYRSRSMSEVANSTEREKLLSTKWPSSSLIKSKTIVGVFAFHQTGTKDSPTKIGMRKNIRSWIFGLIYKLIDPLQRTFHS